jgi:aspartyl-tRNA(Asn)/glutamyl-tRNA(Gln) amidotransferase subunit B
MHFDLREIEKIQRSLPPLPRAEKKKLSSLGLTEAEASQLNDDPMLRALYDAVFQKTRDAKRASSIVITQLKGFLAAQGKTVNEGPGAAQLIELVEAIDSGTISANAGKEVLEVMVETGKSPVKIIGEKGMKQISDDAAIEALVDKAIAANPQAIESYRKGKTAALGAIVGWVMKESKGQAAPGKVNEILKRKIS